MNMKVLIVSHNPITDYNSMGRTMLSLFESFSQRDICQFFIYPTLPNIQKCCSYYRITDKEVMRSFIKRKDVGRKISQEEITYKNTLYENRSEQKLYKNKTSHREIKLMARSLFWKYGGWNNEAFRQWLKEEKPDIIFASAGASAFFYDVIVKISEIEKIPIVTYVCDDFYYSTQPLKNKWIERKYYGKLREKIKRLLNTSAEVVTICDDLAIDYNREFGCKATTIYTGASIPFAKQPVYNESNRISYFGNLQLNRNKSLAQIGKSLDSINEKFNTSYVLNIYTGDLEKEFLSVFDGIKSIHINEFVNSEEMFRLMQKSVMLVHTESFYEDDIERVRYSISTKIADSLASGICLFAYASEKTASMKHLLAHQCAATAIKQEELEPALWDILSNPDKRTVIAKQALKVAETYHSKSGQSEHLKYVLRKCMKENNPNI